MALWTLLSLASTFVLPQLLGVLLYFRLIRFSKWLAFVLGVLAPGFLFFYLAPAFFFPGVREVATNGAPTCGNAAVAAGFMVLLGTAFQFVLAFFVQLHLLIKRG